MKKSKIVRSVCLFSSLFLLGACSNSNDPDTTESGNHVTSDEEGDFFEDKKGVILLRPREQRTHQYSITLL